MPESAASPVDPASIARSKRFLGLLVLAAMVGVLVGSFRGGPVLPALYLGAAGGLMAAQLPGFSTTPAVAVGIAAAVVSVLRLPLAAIVLATLLTSTAGAGAG